jgi:hypothetical protein
MFDKKRVRTRYNELVFLHPMGSAVHVVIPVRPRRETLAYYFLCSVGTGTDLTKNTPGHITPNFYFCIWWDRWVT